MKKRKVRKDTGVPKVNVHNLQRCAVVYRRRSTAEQLRDNPGSTALQYGQREHSVRLGWPESAVIEIDDDLGLSGAGGEHRPGWQRLLQMLAAGEIGAIFASDPTRLSRLAEDVEALLELCKATNTWLVIGGTIYNPNDPAARRWD